MQPFRGEISSPRQNAAGRDSGGSLMVAVITYNF